MISASSIPDLVFEEAEALAKQLNISRSELYTKALQAYLQKYNRHQTLNKLNEVYSQESSELDLFFARMQFLSLESNDW